MVGVRSDKDDGRRIGQRAQAVRQGQAVLAGHMDVQQHHVAGLPAGGRQPGQRLGGGGGFGNVVAWLVAGAVTVSQQGAQAAARQGFVVNDEDVHGALWWCFCPMEAPAG